MSVHTFFWKNNVNMIGLAEYLDRLDAPSRVKETRDLTPREQAMLFEAADGFLPLTLNHFVPESVPAMRPVIHYGRNSLPLFRIFEKRFYRPEGEYASPPIWGYNEQPFKLVTGPGYFTARQSNTKEVVIDYFLVPPYAPPGWPQILPNSARLSRFIYNRTRDTMRGVSRHISVGRAARDGKVMDAWFVLCREGG